MVDEFERGTDGPRVLLAGVDGSRTSMHAASYAAGLARRQGARLVIGHVVTASATSSFAPELSAAVASAQAEALRELRAEAQSGADRLGVPLTFEVRHGDPYRELTALADEVLADAVFVGASSKAGHRLVGSLAVRLVKAGRWPVTVVP
ncbi:MAG: UspA domain protein [Frankiales bacterium]|nr:UspA domain protein [Frankiales bacterium]